jgi:rRNA maturation protein Nop10
MKCKFCKRETIKEFCNDDCREAFRILKEENLVMCLACKKKTQSLRVEHFLHHCTGEFKSLREYRQKFFEASTINVRSKRVLSQVTRDSISRGLNEHYALTDNQGKIGRMMQENIEWRNNISKGKLKYFAKEENLDRHSEIMLVSHDTDRARENARRGQERVWTDEKCQEHSTIMKEVMRTDEMREKNSVAQIECQNRSEVASHNSKKQKERFSKQEERDAQSERLLRFNREHPEAAKWQSIVQWLVNRERRRGYVSGFRKDTNRYARSTWEANIDRIAQLENCSLLGEFEIEPIEIVDESGKSLTPYHPDRFDIDGLFEKGAYLEVKGWRNEGYIRAKIAQQILSQQGKKILFIGDGDWANIQYDSLVKKYRSLITLWEDDRQNFRTRPDLYRLDVEERVCEEVRNTKRREAA